VIVIGLTGSIGMGKSATTQMFRDEGIPVADSDAIIHALYSGGAAPLIEAAFPGTVSNGVVDRVKLAAAVLGNPEALKQLEAITHPLVRAQQDAFLSAARANGAELAVLDIPLLFETGAEKRVDIILVVTAPGDIQRERVLARPGMTEAKLAAILARQLPDAEKRARAHIILDTSNGFEAARAQVTSVIATLRAGRAKSRAKSRAKPGDDAG
jgi:dephospho-CoA kinase